VDAGRDQKEAELSEGRHASDADRRRRRNAIVIAAVVVGLVVFVVGYVLGAGDGESEASASPSSTTSAATSPPTHSSSPSPSSSQEPSGDELPDGRYFVQLNDLQGGEEGPLLIRYDLAYFYTGDEANQVAASRGDETPVPNDVYIVNDNPMLRFAPLAEDFTVRYIPEGTGELQAAPQDRFLAWLGETEQTDFLPKDSTYWWVTIDGGEVTKIAQQYLP
jgi:hypothetical protein